MLLTSGNKIDAIVYFMPQQRSQFLTSTLANDLNLQPLNENGETPNGSVGGEVYYGPDAIPEPE